MKRNSFLLFFIALIFCSCGGRNETITRSFYYWKSGFDLNPESKKILKDLQVKKLYIKFFDVDVFEERVFPKGTLHVSDSIPANTTIVPVVFITNATLIATTSDYALQELGENIVRKIKGIQNCFYELPPVNEVQFDCDWTEESKEGYFKLLDIIQQKLGNTIFLSATIRLHQVKYFDRTGVPPVKRGTLMFYNMGKIDDINSENSIFNEKDASAYLTNFDKYPLPLDVALPVFSWAIAYRDNKIISLINGVDNSLRSDESLKQVKGNLYEVTKTLRYDDVLLMPGDNLKFEETGPEEALSAAKLIRPHLAKDSITVTLFDFNYYNLSRYETRSLEKVFSYFE